MSAAALAAALQNKTLSAAEVMHATLARIAAVNGKVNAVVSLADPDDLMDLARAADAAPAKGPLHGIPMAIKDLSNAAGFPSSMGSPLFKDNIAPRDDIMVARLRAAGAIVIGKTNTPEFGLGSHTFNPVHGATNNPYDLTRSSGGSSGGAAAALAARMVCLADGSDMMGSLRNPAGWNNVYGMRPSWGLVPSEPEGETFLHQLATNGPMARSPQDLALLLDVMAGPDPRQPHGSTAAPAAAQLDGDVAGMRLGWLGDWGGAFPYETGIEELSQSALDGFARDLGCVVDPLAAPFDADALWQAWITLRSFSVGSGLAPLYDDPARRSGLKDTAQWEIERMLKMSAREVNAASVIRSNWFRKAHEIFEQIDVLVLPSAQLWPFPVEWPYPREIAGQAMDTYHRWMQVVIPAGLIGLPVVNVPAGFGANGLPGGLQLIGPRGSDAKLLRLAARWHEATDWPDKRPPKL